VRAAGWYYDIDDFINDNGITSPGSGVGSDCLYNIDHVKLYGGELEAAIRVGERFRGTAAYVYQRYSVDDTGYEEPWTYYLPSLLPRNKVKLLARYMVWQDGWFQLTSQYVGVRKAQRDEDLDEYVTMDVGFEQGFKYDGMKYTAKAFVGNVTGTTYEEVSGYEMPKYVWGFQVGCKF
jgi:outer membrane receptor protein involved in Fe transport